MKKKTTPSNLENHVLADGKAAEAIILEARSFISCHFRPRDTSSTCASPPCYPHRI